MYFFKILIVFIILSFSTMVFAGPKATLLIRIEVVESLSTEEDMDTFDKDDTKIITEETEDETIILRVVE